MVQEQAQEPYSRAMVVVAHPDDAEFGCSGTAVKWSREGVEVVYVIVTDGSKGTSDRHMTPERLVETRNREQLAAGQILGLKEVVFLGYPDAYLQPTLELRRDITRQIRKYRPDVLVTTNPVRNLMGAGYLGHPDHMAAGEAALAAVYPSARDHLTFPELLQEGLEPHKVREVLIIGHPSPDLWIDVTDTIDISIRAIRAHVSQVGGREGLEARMKEGRRQNGKPAGMEYAESFKRFVLP
ncbi:MAG: PIG-L family deacetylase [Chloroflexi bacterium]|nr:PIG-L family deacetylase [Chloroflexota bacterium]